MVETTDNGGGRGGSRWRLAAWSTAVLLWLLPLAAMQVTGEVVWDGMDFAVWGVMLAAAAGAFALATRMSGSIAYRIAVGVAVATAFVIVWANLAVGVVGDEGNPVNLMVYGVIAVGLIGAWVARLRPAGMVRAMVATAVAQGLVALIAVTTGLDFAVVLTGVFVALWLVSAGLFRMAAKAAALGSGDT